MSEQTREKIIETLKGEALNGADTGWLSDLARRGLTWDDRGEIIVIGDWFGSVDIGHLAEVVERLAEQHAKELAENAEVSKRQRLALEVLAEDRRLRSTKAEAQIARVESLAHYLEKLADGDKHYAGLIRSALDGEEINSTL